MSTTLLVVVMLAATLVCPVHMLWQMRRGKRGACCAPARRDQLSELRAGQQALAAELARRARADRPARSDHRIGGTPG